MHNLSAEVEAGVGLTALMVAAARAIETHRDDTLAQDHFAEHFVRAARVCSNWPLRLAEVPDGDANPLWGRLGRYFGLRTRVFDDFLLGVGGRQIVLLGAGLDSRAFRLDWPPGSVVFEIDRAPVLAFKDAVIGTLDVQPKVPRHAIAADLRGDAWVDALLDTGFDAAAPSTWLAEGLFLYLPSAAEKRVIDAVDRLTAAGSTLAFEVKLGVESAAVRDNPVYTATKAQIGVDLLRLFDAEPRPDSAEALTTHGWSTTSRTPFEFTTLHGRGPKPEPDDTLAANRWTFATKPTRP